MFSNTARIGLTLILLGVLVQHAQTQIYKTIYQKIRQEPAYSGFSDLVRNNRVAKLNLHFDTLTVFVPENKAFRKHEEGFRSEIAFYHMSFEVKTLEKLRTTHLMRSAEADNPPLWITKSGQDIYVNNAKILQDKSDYITLRRSGDTDKEQVLHMIDEILDPIIPSPKFPPTAYDFLSGAENWQLGASHTVTSFFHKVQENNLAETYQKRGGHTFFIPVDSGIDPHKFKMINRHTIFGHVVPDYVLFTRPTEKNSPYDTMAYDRFMYIVVSFEEKDGKTFVKGLAGGNLGNGNEAGEFAAEVLVANIPVKNGVVHLVSQPLGVFNRTLKPFPYLPVLSKITSDPELDVFYRMGEETGFNKNLEQKNVKFTYFIPKDTAWIKTRSKDLEATENDLDILNRHLIVSDAPYSMERLLALSRANNYTDIVLNTRGGPLKIMVLKIDQDYYVKWQRRYIKVVRPDYECPDGIIHVLAGPMTVFRNVGSGEELEEIRQSGAGNFRNRSSAMKHYWKGLGNVWSNLF